MRDFYDLKNLPVLTNRKRVMQVSSFDRKEENGDFDNFLYKDKDGSMVMLEETVPGCIRSFWAAVTTDETEMKIYFDGEETPRYVCSVRGFFNGAIPEFTKAGNTFTERGQWEQGDCYCGNFFIPIPYEKGIKITVTGKTDFYYHIMYERYNEDSKAELLSVGTTKAFEDAFNGVAVKHEPTTVEKTVKLASEYTDVYNANESGVVTEFTAEVAEDTDLSNVFLDIAFDEDTISPVACPLTYLFAEPLDFEGVDTLAVKTKIENGKKIMSCYLPMPFWNRITVTLVNFPKDSTEVTIKMRIEENTYDREETGYFHADFRKGLTSLFEDWTLGDFTGRGHVVGLVQTCKGGQWCEGNEHFYIDGELTPSINGTGTEDLYLGCYWPNLKYDSPVAGCINNIFSVANRVIISAYDIKAGYYRFFHDMPISFENGIKLMIQHGAVGQTYSDYSSVCFSYRQKLPKAYLTDTICIGSEVSKKLHGYSAEGKCDKYTLEGKFEADRKSPRARRDGILHDGKISFTAAIEPDNNGVVLRRVTDLSKGPQKAEVFVGDKSVGIWCDPGFDEHAPFGDTDFEIPASVTNGLESLDISIVPADHFTDFEYKIFTRKK